MPVAAPPPQAPAVTPPPPSAPPKVDPKFGVCPVCQASAADATVQCPDCNTRHHRECWDYNNGCGKYGCAAAPETAKINDVEVPVAYWGQTDKECPNCRSKILAAALRCRFCGTVFETAKPLDVHEFREQRALVHETPQLRSRANWLMVFCVLPFTATLALIFGGMWYAGNRKKFAALPAQHAAMPKIALIIAAVQTALLLIVMTLYSLFGPTTQ